MMPDMIHEAFGAEARQLSRVLAGLDDAAFARLTACTPWIVAELVPRAQIPAVAVAPSR